MRLFTIDFYQTAREFFRVLVKEFKDIYILGKAFMRGCFHILYCRLFKKNVKIKLPFLIYSRVKICGPGSVFIDRNCSVFPNAFDGLIIVTLTADAQVHIGRGCDLGGMTIRCRNKVVIGDRVMSANCLLQDTLFFMAAPTSLRVTDMDGSANPNDIWIGKNVWLASQAIVLYGSRIGDGSVLSTGSVCWDLAVPERHLAVGSPVFHSMSISKLNTLLGKP